MDIERLKNNDTFFSGYDDTEIKLYIAEDDEFNLHIWYGYFDDIFSIQPYDDDFKGFTRDYSEMEGIFYEDMDEVGYLDPTPLDAGEYLEDLLLYKDIDFRYPELAQIVDLLIEFFEYAVQNDLTVMVEK